MALGTRDFLGTDLQLIKISVDYSLTVHTVLWDSPAVSLLPSLTRGSSPGAGPLEPFPSLNFFTSRVSDGQRAELPPHPSLSSASLSVLAMSTGPGSPLCTGEGLHVRVREPLCAGRLFSPACISPHSFDMTN